MLETHGLVSVIIPTKNSAANLEACIRSVLASSHEEVEVIVVDDLSTDSTVSIAKRHGVRLVSAQTTMTQARNIGLRVAGGEFILHLDSDMELSQGTIQECVQLGDYHDCLIIPEWSFGRGFWARCRQLEKMLYVGLDEIEAPRFFTKSALIAVGGHDSKMTMGEDWDLAARLRSQGFRVGRATSYILHNENKLTLRTAARKKLAYGRTANAYKRAHPDEFTRQVGIRGRITILKSRWSLIAPHPLRAAGLITLKLVEFCAFWIGSFKADHP
jgi:glycosyltransferase involved in cell wall biosynthesis